MFVQKLGFTQHLFCFDEQFKEIIINTNFYKHLLSCLIMSRYFQTTY